MSRPHFISALNGDDQQDLDVPFRSRPIYLVQVAVIFLLALSMIIGRIDLARFGFGGDLAQTELASVALLVAVAFIGFLWSRDACRRTVNPAILLLIIGLILFSGLVGTIDYIADRPIAWGRIWDVCRIAILIACLNAVLITRADILALALFVIGWVLLVSMASYVLWEYNRTIIISGISWTRILIVALAFATAHLYQRPNFLWSSLVAILAFFLFATSMKSAFIGIIMVLLVAAIFSATVSKFKPVLLLVCAIAVANFASYMTGDVANITSRVAFSAGSEKNPTVIAAQEMISTTILPDGIQLACTTQRGNAQYCLSPYITDTTERLRLWGQGVKLLRANPLKGVGVGGYEQVLIYYGSTESIIYTYGHPHNLFLDVGTLHGSIALLLFLLLLFACLIILLKLLPLSPLTVGYLSGAVAILTMSLFGGDIYDARYIFVFPALAVLGAVSRTQ